MNVFCQILLIVMLPIFLPGAGGVAAETPSAETLFFEANKAYKEGRNQEAVDGYLRLVEDGNINGHLYYNLGNAYFRSGRLGLAILYYKRAQLLIPRDADLNFNLRYALDQTQDAITPSQNFLQQAFFWLEDLTLKELMWGFAVLNILFWGILLLRIFIRPEWTYYFFIVLLIVWLVGGASLALKWHQLKTDRQAVILARQAPVLAGPDADDTVLFKLHEGTTVYRERTEDGWSLIKLSKNKRGWLKSSAIEKIVE